MEPYIRRNVDVSNPHMGEDWIYVGLDLGERIWVAGMLDLRSCSYSTHRFNSETLWRDCLDWLTDMKMSSGCEVHVLYEAGRQGFELARQLRECGIHVDIVAVSRLENAGRRKRGKSDRLDAKSLAYLDWTDRRFPNVWIPDRQQEGMRNLLMWENTLEGSLKRCRNRGLSILARWGLRYKKKMSAKAYRSLIENIDEGDIGEMDYLRLKSLWREEEFLTGELEALSSVRDVCFGSDPDIQKLLTWRGLGEKSARVLAWYVGDWHRFPNGSSFSAYCGLTPVHSRSGSSDIDKGISKSGHPLLRKILGQLALNWQNWQSGSALAKRASEKAKGGKAGRIARTALSRQLAAALWEWMVNNEPIEGATRKTIT